MAEKPKKPRKKKPAKNKLKSPIKKKPDESVIGKTLKAGQLAKVKLYQSFLTKISKGETLKPSEINLYNQLEKELEAIEIDNAPSLNPTQYGKHRGVSRQRVEKYIEKGLLDGAYINERTGKGSNKYKINPIKADKLLEGNLSQENRKASAEEKKRTTKKAGIEDELSFSEARTLNEKYKAALKKLDFEERSGELVLVDEVKRLGFAAGREIRDKLISIPDRCSPLVASESDQFECKQILLKEINFILEGLNTALQISK